MGLLPGPQDFFLRGMGRVHWLRDNLQLWQWLGIRRDNDRQPAQALDRVPPFGVALNGWRDPAGEAAALAGNSNGHVSGPIQ